MFPESFARDIADWLINQLTPFCDRIEIVGSLRRQKPIVNDIDIIAIPRFLQIDDETLFGEPVKEDQLDKQLGHLCLTGELDIESNGPKIKRFIKIVDGDAAPIDLYIASPDTWWTLLLIRTGSRTHNIKLCRRALELGMHLKADGSGLITDRGVLISTSSEEDIFRHLHYEFCPPEEREH